MARAKKLFRGAGIGCLAVVVLAAGALFFTEPGKALQDIWRTGAIQATLDNSKGSYHATTEGNLKAIHTALMLYHESEGQFPHASGWMDAIQNRITTNDLTAEEAAKKLVSPSVAGQPGAFGYAMNDRAGAQYAGDLDPKLLLVFDSSDTSRNAHGSPEQLAPNPPRDGKNLGITVDGTIVEMAGASQSAP